MEVVELEELEEEEEHQRLSSGAPGSALSENDVKEFLEERAEEVDIEGVEAGTVKDDTLSASDMKKSNSDLEEGPIAGDAGGAVDHDLIGESKQADVSHHEKGRATGEQEKNDKEAAPLEDAELEASATPTSLLEQRLHTTSSTRVKSLRRMRLVSGMASRAILHPTGPGGSWDHEQLTKGQFVLLLEQFLGLEPEEATLNAVLQYVKEYYKETIEVKQQQ